MNSLERRVLQKIGEDADNPDVFLDTEDGLWQIRESLNDAVEEISCLTGSTKIVYNLSIQNKSFYRLRFIGDSIGWITDAWLLSQKRRLTQTDSILLNAENPRWMETDASPTHYWPIGHDIIGLYPRPPSDDMLELHCVSIPSRNTTSAQRVKVMNQYEAAAVHYATSEFWASRGSAKEAMNHFEKYIELMGLNSLYPKAAEKVYQLRTK
jgi:hypothetical protein